MRLKCCNAKLCHFAHASFRTESMPVAQPTRIKLASSPFGKDYSNQEVINLGSLNPKASIALGCLVLVVIWAAMGVMVGMALLHREARKKMIHGH
ncbi:hypothetical protein DAI22_12g085800 [Oryza sativa Japonica Group]|nr:hypothetical protein DAI22_12g085800 [Oryza sativa Japonica Group]